MKDTCSSGKGECPFFLSSSPFVPSRADLIFPPPIALRAPAAVPAIRGHVPDVAAWFERRGCA